MTRSPLESIWESLGSSAARQNVTGRRVPNLPPGRAVYAAIDSVGRRHLLILVPDGIEPIVARETRGLHVATGKFEVGSNPEATYIDLACHDVAHERTFSAVAQDLVVALQHAADDLPEIVRSTLGRWRAFWSVPSTGLSRDEALGLFGELWFLRCWLTPVTAELIAHWQADPAARHDFQWQRASVEVKTTACSPDATPVHRISSLDQLDDPLSGELYLFSLQLADDALATETLPCLVGGILEDLRDAPEAVIFMNQKLAQYGYNPAEAERYDRHFRVISERLYRVYDGFPRLTRATFGAGLPAGITDVMYSVALSACDPWLTARSARDAGAAALLAVVRTGA